MYQENKHIATPVGAMGYEKRYTIMKSWQVPFIGALILGIVGVFFWLLRFETTGQLLWFLSIVVLLWFFVYISLLLRPRSHKRVRASANKRRPRFRNWTGSRALLERLFPGGSLPSGTYNKGDAKVWDENEHLPPGSL